MTDDHGSGGLSDDRVELMEYQPAWERRFERERALLLAIQLPGMLDIEHIGSTAVRGMKAKPIIDIALRVKGPESEPVVERLLVEAGYRALGEYGLPGRRFFRKGIPTRIHLHVVRVGHRLWDEWLALRDRLREDPVARDAYEVCKVRLSRLHPGDRDAYTCGKSPVIQAILKGPPYEF